MSEIMTMKWTLIFGIIAVIAVFTIVSNVNTGFIFAGGCFLVGISLDFENAINPNKEARK